MRFLLVSLVVWVLCVGCAVILVKEQYPDTQHLSPRFCFNDGAEWESGVCSKIGKTWPI